MQEADQKTLEKYLSNICLSEFSEHLVKDNLPFVSWFML